MEKSIKHFKIMVSLEKINIKGILRLLCIYF